MPRFLSRLLFSLCAAALVAASAARANESAQSGGLTPKILYQFLLAELAAQNGQYGLAVNAHLDLAKHTRDPAVARRATEMGLSTRQFELALEAARLFAELAPADQTARHLLTTALIATQRFDELAAALAAELAAAGEQTDLQLLRLNRLLGRLADKQAVQRLVEQVTVPYVGRPEAQMARAQAAAAVRDGQRSLQAIDRALELRPDWEMAALFKAQQLPRGADQVGFLQGFIAANPGAHEARLAYARALVGEKRYAESRVEFRTLLSSFPENADVINAVGVLSLQLDDPKEAEVQFRRLLELNKGDQNTVRYYLGQLAEQGKRLDEALAYYDGVGGGEHQVSALMRAAQLLARQKRVDEAVQRLRAQRARLSAEAPRLILAEAQLLRDAGRAREVFETLQGGLRENPDQPELLYELALAAERMERMAETERYLRRYIELKPLAAQGYNALGYSLADRGERLEEAQELIDKALSLAPGDPFILDSKGWVLFRRGQPVAALELLQQAYGQRPDPEIAAHVGEVLWSLGRRDDARRIWQEATQAHPENAVLAATIKRLAP